jgi:hypothetical protein
MIRSRYPIVFCVIILPFSVVRWMTFQQEGKGHTKASIPDAATFTSVFLFALSGTLNAILYLLTRRRLLWGSTGRENLESTTRALFHTEMQDNIPPSLPATEVREA